METSCVCDDVPVYVKLKVDTLFTEPCEWLTYECFQNLIWLFQMTVMIWQTWHHCLWIFETTAVVILTHKGTWFLCMMLFMQKQNCWFWKVETYVVLYFLNHLWYFFFSQGIKMTQLFFKYIYFFMKQTEVIKLSSERRLGNQAVGKKSTREQTTWLGSGKDKWRYLFQDIRLLLKNMVNISLEMKLLSWNPSVSHPLGGLPLNQLHLKKYLLQWEGNNNFVASGINNKVEVRRTRENAQQHT